MISQETSKRIAKDAETFAESEATALAKMGLPRDQAQTACAGYYDGYIAGAEAWATRAERLLTLLKKINDDAGTDLSMPLWEELERTLNNYNKTDK